VTRRRLIRLITRARTDLDKVSQELQREEKQESNGVPCHRTPDPDLLEARARADALLARVEAIEERSKE
jgi:hypothetical protein